MLGQFRPLTPQWLWSLSRYYGEAEVEMAEQSDTTNPSSSSPDRAEKIRNLVNDLDDADIGIEAGTIEFRGPIL